MALAIKSKEITKDQVSSDQVSSQEARIRQVVDRLGEIDQFIKLMKPKLDEYNKLKKELLAYKGDLNSPVVLSGDRFEVELSPATKTREVTDKQGLASLLGMDAFLAVSKVSLSELDKYLEAHEQEPFIVTKPGSRRIKSIRKKEV